MPQRNRENADASRYLYVCAVHKRVFVQIAPQRERFRGRLAATTLLHATVATRAWARGPRSCVRWVCVGSVPFGFRGARFPAGAPLFPRFKTHPGPGAPPSPCVGTAYHLGNGMVNHGASREISPRWLRNRAQRGTGWLPHAAGHSGTHRACPRARVRGYAPQARATSGRPRAPHRLWPVRGVCCAL